MTKRHLVGFKLKLKDKEEELLPLSLIGKQGIHAVMSL